jgi:hypothetical protein
MLSGVLPTLRVVAQHPKHGGISKGVLCMPGQLKQRAKKRQMSPGLKG